MLLKVFVLPIKNLGAAEAEMNAFFACSRIDWAKNYTNFTN